VRLIIFLGKFNIKENVSVNVCENIEIFPIFAKRIPEKFQNAVV
jgi:hypothetical protein